MPRPPPPPPLDESSSATLSPIARAADDSTFSSILGALGESPGTANGATGATKNPAPANNQNNQNNNNNNILALAFRRWRDRARMTAIARREERLREQYDRLEELSLEMENDVRGLCWCDCFCLF
jgi:hypothetical protein